MAVANWIQRVQRNPVFKFTASVKLAVPLMLILGSLVAYGTIVESNYNSDYAKLSVYNTSWFLLLEGVLFLNILNAALSRWPWRKHHVGFVITHLGLLTLLTGAFITAMYGVDGQLRVTEGSSARTVVLSRLMLSYRLEGSPRAQTVVFDKTLREKSASDLGFINETMGHILHAEKLLPFATVQKTYATSAENSDAVALSFILRSQFFNVSEWLHSSENPEMQLGPATLRLIKDVPGQGRRVSSSAEVARPQAVAHHPGPAGSETIVIRDVKSGSPVATWDLKKHVFQFKNVKFALKHDYRHALVSQNKLVEGPDQPEVNRALELEVTAGASTLREILFAKFPNFSLNKNGVFGYALEFKSAATPAEGASQGESHAGAMASTEEPSSPPPMGRGLAPGGHIVEFHVDPSQPKQARVVLLKDGKVVGSQVLSEGQSLQTPWMGMKIFLGTLAWGSTSSLEAHAVEPQRGQELPPSAIELRQPGSETPQWLSEGDTRTLQFNGRPVEVYFGRETLELPFQVALQKFTKTDYPGTETPMSYESVVEVGDGISRRIAMNEPLVKDGFTLYQASYQMNENGPPDSIFSVNRDPGRRVKYSGSLILALGIVTFTLTRSRRYQRWTGGKA